MHEEGINDASFLAGIGVKLDSLPEGLNLVAADYNTYQLSVKHHNLIVERRYAVIVRDSACVLMPVRSQGFQANCAFVAPASRSCEKELPKTQSKWTEVCTYEGNRKLCFHCYQAIAKPG